MSDDVVTYEFTINRSELIPGGNGAMMGYSDEFPDTQFLIVPASAVQTPVDAPESPVGGRND